MAKHITPAEAKRQIHQPSEIAVVDVREAGEFGEGHLLFAVPCPYSRLEIDFPRLVPRRATRTILVDGGDGVGERAANRLECLGYSDVAVIDGGLAAWTAAGFGIFKGVNVPSKLLGELAEHVYAPQRIDAGTLSAWKAEGKRFLFFDTRPPAEHAKMRVPGAVCLPNGELAHRWAAAVPDETTPVLLTCAGRTRGLIGAAGLAAVGVNNPVYALENGTQGWALAGYALERSNAPAPYPELDAGGQNASAERANALCENDDIEVIDAGRVGQLLGDETRTTHVLDVRSAGEVQANPIPAARHALGVQLIQSTDQWVGTRRSRIVLVDDTGLRASLAAFWLKRLGYEVYVHRIDQDTYGINDTGERGTVAHKGRERLATAATGEANASLDAGEGLLIDLRSSARYRIGHAAGAVWSIRPLLDRVDGIAGKSVYLFADDERIGELAAVDIKAAGANAVALVAGGLSAWQEAGLQVVKGATQPAPEDAIDFLWFVHDRHDGNLEASRQYLAWEQGLMAQTDDAERAEFRL